MRTLLVLLLWAAPASATGPIVEPTEAMVADIVTRLRPMLPLARLDDGSPVPEETTEQLARDIIPPPLAFRTARQGSITGELQVCGGDWEGRSYLPFMSGLRQSGNLEPRQLAFIGMLHGVFQELVRSALAEGGLGSCSKRRIEALEGAARAN
jgi:hypothetical protein